MKWYVVDKEYITYLKQFDYKVGNVDYKDKFKPYIGTLLGSSLFRVGKLTLYFA